MSLIKTITLEMNKSVFTDLDYNLLQLTDLDSNNQLLVPSSSTLFHHLNPANNLPLMFLTTQKSTANIRIIANTLAVNCNGMTK